MSKEPKKYEKSVFAKSIVSEPALRYAVNSPLRVVSDISDSDKYAYLKVIQKGLSHDVLLEFMTMSGFNLEEMADLLRLNSRTLRRLDPSVPLNIDLSEKLIDLLRLYKIGIDIFGDADTFNTWLRRSIAGLGHIKPISLMHTNIGLEIITDELERLAHGVYS